QASRRGAYRFRAARNGRYRLGFELPEGWRVALDATTARIRTFTTPDGRSLVLVPGSYGRQFDVTSGGDLAIDVPLEPDWPSLTVEKTTTASDVSEGDILTYAIRIASAGGDGRMLALTDVFPRGFRYVDGSLRIPGARADAGIDADGQTLNA